jgi:RHH-type transcriptional regulator, proline utilization regulon repressor / proline dehydrogenase / delta 1-pyrroline-5-carboxylate dehydrogenase
MLTAMTSLDLPAPTGDHRARRSVPAPSQRAVRPHRRTDAPALQRRLDAATEPGLRERARAAVHPASVAMRWATRRPGFKTQLFRFVDVLPSCTDPATTMRHLEEYLDGADSPGTVRRGLAAARAVPGGARLATAAARIGVQTMGDQFIIGADADEAIPAVARLWKDGFATTLDLLGEKTLTAAEADRYAERVLAVLLSLTDAAVAWPERTVLTTDPWGELPRVNVSVKPTALSPLLTPHTIEAGVRDALRRLRPILDVAARAGATVHLDSEHDEAKDATFALVTEIARHYPAGPQLGCVVQAYRRDAMADLDRLIELSRTRLAVPLQIRLVKGAYWDVETIHARSSGWESPVWSTKAESDDNFARCAEVLVANAGAVRPAFASHNTASIAHAVSAARALGLPDSAIEIQVLHGMAESLHRALRDEGLRVRVYAPMGDLVPGMAYLVRRLLENTANESFVRQRYVDPGAAPSAAAPSAAAPSAAAPSAAMPERPGTQARDTAGAATFRNEPVAELRRHEVAQRLVDAVQGVRSTLPLEVPVLVPGLARGGRLTAASVDPSDGTTVVAHWQLGTADDAAAAVAAVTAGQPSWAARTASERAAVIRSAAALMRRHRDELTALIVLEAGKPFPEADADVAEAVDFCEYYAADAERMDDVALAQVPGERNVLRHRPRGVAAVIAPWNFPLAIPCGMVTAALVTGNAVVFKPAEQTPAVGHRMVQLLHEAGVPHDVLAFVPGIGETVGPVLVDHPGVHVIAFTGSRAVGLDIVRRAAEVRPGARHVKRVIAEMGGKNAIVVDASADLDVAVPAILASAFHYAGQKCSAASRVIVVAAVHDLLVQRLGEALALLRIGPAWDPATEMGPVIDQESMERVRAYQRLAEREGTVVAALDPVGAPAQGTYVPAMIVAVDDPRARIAQEEVFGPVLSVLRADDLDHAFALANDTDYALTASVFSRTPSTLERAQVEVACGNLYLNRGSTGAMVGRQPFGGHRLSGVGAKAGGPGYLDQFVHAVAVCENTIRQGFSPDLMS